MTTAQVIAGTKAKRVGHENEQRICEWLNEEVGGVHVVDGTPNTKQDSIDIEENIS